MVVDHELIDGLLGVAEAKHRYRDREIGLATLGSAMVEAQAVDGDVTEAVAGSLGWDELERLTATAAMLTAAIDPDKIKPATKLRNAIAQGNGRPFSIRQWVREGKGSLWLPYRINQLARLRGTIGTWLSVAIMETLEPAGGAHATQPMERLDAPRDRARQVVERVLQESHRARRIWISWWCLVPIALLVLFLWLNTRVFPPGSVSREVGDQGDPG